MPVLLRLLRALALVSLSAVAVRGQSPMGPTFDPQKTVSVGIVAFPGFEPLDIFGPLEIMYRLSYTHNMTLSIVAAKPGPISARAPPHSMAPGEPPMELDGVMAPTIVATHSFANAPALDVLVVPGGIGITVLELANDSSVEDFVAARFEGLQYLLSVCTGAISLAKSGVLEGRRATSSKQAWAQVSAHGRNVTWVPTARWVQDGKVWTSSGVAAGIDMTYAFLRHAYGDGDNGVADVMNIIEYAPHTNPHWDPFSIVYNVPGADRNGSLEDVTRPVGF